MNQMLCKAYDTHLLTECSFQSTKYSYKLDCVYEESEALFCPGLSSDSQTQYPLPVSHLLLDASAAPRTSRVQDLRHNPGVPVLMNGSTVRSLKPEG